MIINGRKKKKKTVKNQIKPKMQLLTDDGWNQNMILDNFKFIEYNIFI